MGFNELSIEHYVIHKLSGTDLSNDTVSEPKPAYGPTWIYKSTHDLDRATEDVFVESELREALIRLNPEIAKNPNHADDVVHELRGIVNAVNQTGLVRANEQFFEWLTGEKTMPFGENHRHVPVRLIDFDKLTNNTYIVTNQFS